MFKGPMVWRGVIYSTLMLIAKLLCGAWLLRFSVSMPNQEVLREATRVLTSTFIPHLWGRQMSRAHDKPQANGQGTDQDIPVALSTARNADIARNAMSAESGDDRTTQCAEASMQHDCYQAAIGTVCHDRGPAPKSFSLYPSAILGLAMVARGEIGFLISSLADSNGIFSADGGDQIFLIVTWAIVLCTFIGPVGVGLLVRRAKGLEKANEGTGGRVVLGVWGVS